MQKAKNILPKKITAYVLLFLFSQTTHGQNYRNGINNFNYEWQFVKSPDSLPLSHLSQKDKSQSIVWENISIPHTANIEPAVISEQQWQGICWYRKFFGISKIYKDKVILLQFDAAMQVADVYINGKHVFKHQGGYLPFVIDISKEVYCGQENCILIKLDNRDNQIVPPGKPIAELDFCYYSGIYRNVSLIIKDRIHITNPTFANKAGGGGLYVSYPYVTDRLATIQICTDIQNSYTKEKKVKVAVSINTSTGKQIGFVESEEIILNPQTSKSILQSININNPQLWMLDNPYLYRLNLKILANKKIADSESINIGIRAFTFTKSGFVLNGENLKIRGTNRHQEYPYIGNALSDNAQYRDAYKIKKAGFNFVRCSHYPPSTAFLDACDKLGIMVMDAIPGWQFFGNKEFQENSTNDIRNMVRRDRNHASIILWEASLNETEMEAQFIKRACKTVKEELPYGENYTAGWIDSIYDVFLPARQHAKPPHYWNEYKKEIPMLIAEYGDWEYYADNAGFNQKEFKDLSKEERNSRQLRGYGEKRLAQQALNYQESHNSNQLGNAIGDANWLMFDYNRGYAPDIEASGIMDIFRIPKFAYYFYQSQSSFNFKNRNGFYKPMIYIANYWSDSTYKTVKVYSNCDEVELKLNGQVIARSGPDQDINSTKLSHPPFTFIIPDFKPGELTASGYCKKLKIIETSRKTYGKPSQLQLDWDKSGKSLNAGCNDAVFVYATVTDANKMIVSNYDQPIKFIVKGPAEIIGPNHIRAEAGIASTIIKARKKPGKIVVIAQTSELPDKELNIYSE